MLSPMRLLPLFLCFLLPLVALADARQDRVRDLYLALLDRGLLVEGPRVAGRLGRDLTDGRAPSRFSLFHAYGAAVRAASLPAEDPLRALLLKRAQDALRAYTAAIGTHRSAMADQLLFSQNTVVRLYEKLVALDALPAELSRSTLLDALAAGADAALELKKERGPFNRSFHLAFGLADTARLLPDHPHAPAWRAFAQAVWADFATPGDTFEDSSGYNGLWSYGTVHLAALLHRTPELRGPSQEAIFDRFLAYMAPNGALPDFGNASYFLHGAAYWLDALERLGALSGRADFQDAAERLAGFMLRQPGLADYELEPIAEALDALAPAQTPSPARPAAEITYRKTDYGDRVPDKLLLRVETPLGPAFVCVDLHDGGYHGHADGGTLSLFTLGNSILLHELGRAATTAHRHNTALAAHPDDGFPLPVTPPGEWTSWIINHRWPGTYVGQFAPDIGRAQEFFFRLQGEPTTIEVASVTGERADGATKKVAGPWRGVPPKGRASAFTTTKALSTVDLTAFVRLHVRWRADVPASVQFFGLNAPALHGDHATDRGTLRTWAAQPVVVASVEPDATTPIGRFTRLLRDTRGRLVRHERTLTLYSANARLVVTDRFTSTESGDSVVGPVWHADSLRRDGDGWKLTDTRQSKFIATPVMPLSVAFESSSAVDVSATGNAPATLSAAARLGPPSGAPLTITTTLVPTP